MSNHVEVKFLVGVHPLTIVGVYFAGEEASHNSPGESEYFELSDVYMHGYEEPVTDLIDLELLGLDDSTIIRKIKNSYDY